MGIKVKSKGDFKNTELFLKNAKNFDPIPILERYGAIGVDALREYTPKATGRTAASWYYEIEKTKKGYILSWNNRNVVDGISVAILIQYGHGTQSGTYVQGVDYINPALRNVFQAMSKEIRREVSK